jgi:transposase
MAKVTDAQVKELRKWLQGGASLKKAALKAGMDRKTARKYRRKGQLPSQTGQGRTWRTRPDPLAAVWLELEVELAQAPGLQANTLLEILQQRYPGQYAASVLRTLQRRLKRWRALAGPAKEVFFTQRHEPGRLGSSDFTHMNSLQVTIGGQPFAHLVYHFVLTYSNWEHVTVCFSETFASLSEGLQNALWALNGVPARHRTDRMTLAVHADGQAETFTPRYRALLAHYGLEGEATNPASGHENGDCEQGHRRFKEAVEQALLVRGSRDFASREEYDAFLRTVQERRNAGRWQRLAEELTQLQALPGWRLESVVRLEVKVGQGSTIRVQHNTYSVPARLIGERVEARVGLERVEVWYAEQLQLTLPRLRGQDKHHIDYRHVIDWLERKPGALARYCYLADLFPTSRFRQAYDELVRTRPERVASREYLGILRLAARGSESGVDGALASLWAEGRAVSVAAVAALLASDIPMSVTALVQVPAVNLRSYDELLESVGLEPTTVSWSGFMSQGREETDDGTGTKGVAGGVFAGVASASDAAGVRGGGAAGPAGVVELPGLSARTGRARGAAAPAQPHQPAAQGLAAAVGEELAEPGSEAPTPESDAAVAEPVVGRLSGPARECAGIRHGGFGQDAQCVCAGPGTGTQRPAHSVHDDEPVGAGTLEGQARSGAQDVVEATQPLGGVVDRRPGLCAAEPGGDGSAVHAAGGALRTGQRAGDEQPGVLAVGTDLQGSDDDGGGDRPSGASLRDPGVECAQLPGGGGAEGQAGPGAGEPGKESRARAGVATRELARPEGNRLGEGDRVGPPLGAGEAPLASASVAVAALRLPPLRLAPLPQPPTAEDFGGGSVGIFNCR